MATGNLRLMSYIVTAAEHKDKKTIGDLLNRVLAEIPIIAHILAQRNAVSVRNDSVYTLSRKER